MKKIIKEMFKPEKVVGFIVKLVMFVILVVLLNMVFCAGLEGDLKKIADLQALSTSIILWAITDLKE